MFAEKSLDVIDLYVSYPLSTRLYLLLFILLYLSGGYANRRSATSTVQYCIVGRTLTFVDERAQSIFRLVPFVNV